jgi:hypothetical protein
MTTKNILVEGGRIMPLDTPTRSQSQYGAFSPAPKKFHIALDAERSKERLSIGGSFLWAFNASSIDAVLDIGFNTEVSDLFTVKWGFQIGGLKFSEVYITNTAQPGEYMEFLVVDIGNLFTLNPINATNAVTISGVAKNTSDTIGTVADVTVVAAAAAAQVIAANTSRMSVQITSLSTNTQVVRVGDSNVGASRGDVLNPGESISYDTTAAIFAYTGAGADQTLAISYLEY